MRIIEKDRVLKPSSNLTFLEKSDVAKLKEVEHDDSLSGGRDGILLGVVKATSSTPGIVQPDNTTIGISNGKIQVISDQSKIRGIQLIDIKHPLDPNVDGIVTIPYAEPSIITTTYLENIIKLGKYPDNLFVKNSSSESEAVKKTEFDVNIATANFEMSIHVTLENYAKKVGDSAEPLVHNNLKLVNNSDQSIIWKGLLIQTDQKLNLIEYLKQDVYIWIKWNDRLHDVKGYTSLTLNGAVRYTNVDVSANQTFITNIYTDGAPGLIRRSELEKTLDYINRNFTNPDGTLITSDSNSELTIPWVKLDNRSFAILSPNTLKAEYKVGATEPGFIIINPTKNYEASDFAANVIINLEEENIKLQTSRNSGASPNVILNTTGLVYENQNYIDWTTNVIPSANQIASNLPDERLLKYDNTLGKMTIPWAKISSTTKKGTDDQFIIINPTSKKSANAVDPDGFVIIDTNTKELTETVKQTVTIDKRNSTTSMVSGGNVIQVNDRAAGINTSDLLIETSGEARFKFNNTNRDTVLQSKSRFSIESSDHGISLEAGSASLSIGGNYISRFGAITAIDWTDSNHEYRVPMALDIKRLPDGQTIKLQNGKLVVVNSGNDGLKEVSHDDTLNGRGTSTDQLSVKAESLCDGGSIKCLGWKGNVISIDNIALTNDIIDNNTLIAENGQMRIPFVRENDDDTLSFEKKKAFVKLQNGDLNIRGTKESGFYTENGNFNLIANNLLNIYNNAGKSMLYDAAVINWDNDDDGEQIITKADVKKYVQRELMKLADGITIVASNDLNEKVETQQKEITVLKKKVSLLEKFKNLFSKNK